MARSWKPRLLPVLIAISTITAGLRVADAVSRLVAGAGIEPVRSAHAEPAKPDSATTSPTDSTAAGTAGTAGAAGAQPTGDADPAAAVGAGRHDVPDAGYSGAEVELLQSLSKRRAELDQRDAELQQRAAMLKVGEDRVNQKVAELSQLKADIEKLLDLQKQKEDEQLNSLVKIYSDMKAPDAARIFDTLDMPVLVRVVGHMKEQKSAPIIAAMEPDRARELTQKLAELRRLPEAGRGELAGAPTPIAPPAQAAPPAPAQAAAPAAGSGTSSPPQAAAPPQATMPAQPPQAASDAPAPASPKAPRSTHHTAPAQASAASKPAG